jgi:O-antigen ligase
VAGAALSVLIGLASNGLTSSASAIDTATSQEGRLQGGAGDPNVLAAGLVPAIVLAAALASGARGAGARWALGFAILVMGVGVAATESRGGMLAMVVALVASLAVAKGRRVAIVALAAFAIGGAAAWFVNSPSGWERITSFDGGGNGRSDLWAVAGDMAHDHPIVGVGLANFQERAGEYVRRPRELQFVDLIAEEPHVAHNTYLQFVAENGLLGLAIFLALAAAALHAALTAGRRFDANGDDPLATLSRAVFVGILALMTASIFLTNGHDSRLWLLFGLAAILAQLSRVQGRPGLDAGP